MSEAAHALFMERAYGRVSIAEILERSGVSRGALYHHFLTGYLRAAESDDELRRIGLGQSRTVLGWEGWREAATGLGLGIALAGVTAAVEAGELPPHDPETMAIVVLGATIEGAMLVVTADDPAAARERSEAVIVDLLEGLRR